MKRILCLLLCVGLSPSILFGVSANQLKREGAIHTDIVDLLKKRYSGRFFDKNRSVSQQQVVSLVEAARWAPSCYNDQPWYFIFCDKQKNPQAYEAALSSLVPFNKEWASSAPLLIIAVSSSLFRHSGEPNRWSAYDTGAASFSLCLQATAMGLMTHQMGGYSDEVVRKAFEIPDGYQTQSVIAIGYELQNQKESDIKNDRRPPSENFFFGKWGAPLL